MSHAKQSLYFGSMLAISACSMDSSAISSESQTASVGPAAADSAGTSASTAGAGATAAQSTSDGPSGAAGSGGSADATASAEAGSGGWAAGAAGRGSSPPTAAGAGVETAGAAATSGEAGAPGTDSPSNIPATFATAKLVFGGGGGITTCAAAPCHGINGAAPPDDPLELPTNDDDLLYKNLTSYTSKTCGNIKLVDPGNPTQSALIKILKGPCGTTPRMPYGCSEETGDCIPNEYIEALTQWITNGAPRE